VVVDSGSGSGSRNSSTSNRGRFTVIVVAMPCGGADRGGGRVRCWKH